MAIIDNQPLNIVQTSAQFTITLLWAVGKNRTPILGPIGVSAILDRNLRSVIFSGAMTSESLERALRQPRPFTLFLTDGRQIWGPHPEFVWLVPPQKSSLVLSHGRRGGVELLWVNQIVSILFRG
ncbi:MAG: hypothetical protein EXS38_07020 [Opitutus sp.]|nr:hypothetical protein [Opitutus sp.]